MRLIELVPDSTRFCKRCKQAKKIAEFKKDNRRPSGYRSICKACCRGMDRASERRYRVKNKAALKIKSREKQWRAVGIDASWNHKKYAELLQAQHGKCAVCGLPEFENIFNTLAVDHDHTTGKVRGLLCNPCNQALGDAKDSVAILAALIQYLERSR